MFDARHIGFPTKISLKALQSDNRTANRERINKGSLTQTKPAVNRAIRTISSIAILGMVLFLLDSHRIIEKLANVEILSLLFAVILILVALAAASWRLHLLLAYQRVVLSVRRTFAISLSTIFYGLVIPGGTIAAFALRLAQLSRHAKLTTIATCLFLDRVVASVFLILLGLLAIAVDYMHVSLLPLLLLLPTLITVMLGNSRVRNSLLRLIQGCSRRTRTRQRSRFASLTVRIFAATEHFLCLPSKQYRIILIATVLAHLFGCLAFYAVAKGIGLDLSFVTICWVRSGIILACMLPVTVAGIGVREVATMALLLPLGVSEADAVSYSLTVFISTVLIVGLIGGATEVARTGKPLLIRRR